MEGFIMKISASVMPASNVGRKKIPVDVEAVDYFVTSLREDPIQELDDDFRPKGYGPDHRFEKASRAQSEGRRYAKAVKAKLGATVRVNVYSNADGVEVQEGSADERFLWRLYIPLAEGMELMDVTDVEADDPEEEEEEETGEELEAEADEEEEDDGNEA